MNGQESLIRCPTVVTASENDSLFTTAKAFYDSLTCLKTLLTFSADQGAGDHCKMKNRSLLTRRVLEWLEETFEV